MTGDDPVFSYIRPVLAHTFACGSGPILPAGRQASVSISPSTEQVLPVVAQERLNAELDDGPEEQADDGPRRGVLSKENEPTMHKQILEYIYSRNVLR